MTPYEIIARLPAPHDLENLSLAIAALDAILSPEWHDRYFSFDPAWSPMERMASMRNGSGDGYFAVFAAGGTVLRAFDHESALSPWRREDGTVAPELLQGFPESLRSVIDEPAFRTEGGPSTDLTFCVWSQGNDGQWHAGPIDDDGGATELLEVVLDGTPLGYQTLAIDYFELDLGVADIEALYALQPADVGLIARINPNVDPNDILTDLASFGYPVGEPGAPSSS